MRRKESIHVSSDSSVSVELTAHYIITASLEGTAMGQKLGPATSALTTS